MMNWVMTFFIGGGIFASMVVIFWWFPVRLVNSIEKKHQKESDCALLESGV